MFFVLLTLAIPPHGSNPGSDLLAILLGQTDKPDARLLFRFRHPHDLGARLDGADQLREAEAEVGQGILTQWLGDDHGHSGFRDVRDNSAVIFGESDVGERRRTAARAQSSLPGKGFGKPGKLLWSRLHFHFSPPVLSADPSVPVFSPPSATGSRENLRGSS
jgi:hypothetical protein